MIDWRLLRRVAETVALGASGAFALGLSGFPAGWLSGAIVAVSIAALCGRPVVIPDLLSRVTFVVIGISLGGAVTPATLSGMATWPLSLAILALAMVALTALVATYLRVVHGWDRASALFASFPGALATILVLAAENKADVRAVAVVQTVRVVALALLLPALVAALGLVPPQSSVAVPVGLLSNPRELALLVAISTGCALATHVMRMPGGLMFGAMVSSAVLHGGGWITVTLPAWLTIAAFIVLGSLTGTRFANTDLRLLRHLAAAALGALVISIAAAFSFGLTAAWLLSQKTADVIIAYAPGALDAMMILALALNLDPAFVGAHHLSRFILVLIVTPLVIPFVRPPADAPPER